ncbi:A24 family peptidase [Gudongella sp. SC589]|uniref:A24 family peptidase n=1 Tax=Gudongella sp. SC589 TaxID=3385990 RepID=UPI003904B68A
MLNTTLLLILVTVSSYHDVTSKRIPNFITIPVILWGLLTYTVFDGYAGLKFSGLGFLVGLGVFLVPYILGGMGGGDVKLMAAIGALKGWRFVLYTTVYTGLAGGVIVILILIKEKKLWITLKRVVAIILKPIIFIITLTFNSDLLKRVNNWLLKTQVDWEKRYIPYGVAIGIGAVISYFI